VLPPSPDDIGRPANWRDTNSRAHQRQVTTSLAATTGMPSTSGISGKCAACGDARAPAQKRIQAEP
jgi:hypothetical protein